MKKNSLLMFVDYFLVIIMCMLGIMIFSWLLSFSWGYVAYSVFFSLVFFGMIYSRAWKTAKKELKNKERKPKISDGFKISLPLTVFNILVIAFFALVLYNIIPIRDNVVNIVYSFAANEPRVRSEILFINYIVPIVRIWFAPLIGFMPQSGNTSPLILLLSPIITVSASLLGYFLGMKKYYISDSIAKVSGKVKDKFNE